MQEQVYWHILPYCPGINNSKKHACSATRKKKNVDKTLQ